MSHEASSLVKVSQSDLFYFLESANREVVIAKAGYNFGTGITEAEFADKAPQGELDFSQDPETESLFPSCSGCASLDDLHLVEMQGGTWGRPSIFQLTVAIPPC
jgi:hypothetical protein